MFKTLRKQKRQEGFTLMELLVTVFILAIGILSAMAFYINAMRATEYAGEITEATTHAEHLFEEMYTRNTLANITSTNWLAWASSQNLMTLPSETIDVVFTNAAADPLEISTTVRWTKYSRERTLDMQTKLTK